MRACTLVPRLRGDDGLRERSAEALCPAFLSSPGGFVGKWIAIGIALGVAIGAMYDHIGIGIGIGVALGIALGSIQRNRQR